MAVYVKASDLDIPEARKALVEKWCAEVAEAKKHFERDFKRMRQDMDLVRRGAPREWEDLENYIVNVLQRYVRSKTATLYAKNPVSIHKRKPRMDFVIWDGKPSSMNEAQQAVQMFQQAQMVNAEAGGTLMGGPIETPPVVQDAMALLADIQSGMARRDLIDRVGKTLTLLHKHYQDEQQPRYKARMKAMVRQAISTGVGYVKLGFHREMGKSPTTQQQIADSERRLAHMRRLAAEQAEGESTETEADAAELLQMLDSLMAAEDIVLKEGLTYDFPQSTALIPDTACTCLKGFVGADWVAEEFFYTPDEVKELFGVDIGDMYNGHSADRESRPAHDPNDNKTRAERDTDGLALVWEIYHMSSGLRYVVCDGYIDFLEEPAPPQVQLERFWPWFVYSYNELPHEKAIFPYSDVHYMKSSQFEINRSREAMNQHRIANRPKYATPDGMLDDDDKDALQNAEGNTVITLRGLTAGQNVDSVLQPIAQTGVDPNLYVTNPYFEDIQMSVGAQEATFGATSGSTATESSIAAASQTASTESEGDELNDLLSDLAREAGQILLSHVPQDRVKQIVGPGAVWPEIQLDDMRDEIYLDVVAGSNGRPNRAHRAQTLQMIAPIMLQVPGFKPDWLAQQLVTVLDEGLDFESAFAAGMPSMQAMNQAAAAIARSGQGVSPEAAAGGAAAPAGQDPALQGGAGMSPAPLTQPPGGTPGMPETPIAPQLLDVAA